MQQQRTLDSEQMIAGGSLTTSGKPQTVLLHEAALTEVQAILDRLAPQRIFFVVDQDAYFLSGASLVLGPVLNTTEFTLFTDFEPNPKLEDVQRGVESFQQCEHDLVLAFGGGTAIDLAKMIGLFSSQQSVVQPENAHQTTVRELATGEISCESPGPPLLTIPTTAGTGSEATHFAVVYVDGEKFSVAHPYLLPDYVIIDPLLTESLPASMTAASGLDAFCQAIESIWAVGATEESVGYAAEAVQLALTHLVEATHRTTRAARLGMCKASHLAGKAINISKTTLPHALSYGITSEYGIPHGAAVAMTLGSAFEFNAQISETDCLDPRGVDHVRKRLKLIQKLLGASSVKQAAARIHQFITDLDCAPSLLAAGVNDYSEFVRLAGMVNAVRLSNNPRRTTPNCLVQLLATDSTI